MVNGNGRRGRPPQTNPTDVAVEAPVEARKYNFREVFISDIPKPKYTGGKRSKWADLYEEMMPLLNDTSDVCALEVLFEAKKTAQAAKDAVMRMAERDRGLGCIVMKVRPKGQKWGLYAQKGPNWK